MTVVAASLKRGGLLYPLPSSSAIGDDAKTLKTMIQEVWNMLAQSLAVRQTAEAGIVELRRAQQVASKPNWDGYGALPLDARAFQHVVRFLQALPTTMPVPDVGVDPDGEIDLLWHVDSRKTFSVSIGSNGRLTYSGLFGDVQSYGTEWLFNEIPQTILFNLSRVVDTSGR
ncbi:MAG: hypothetical protein AUH43_16910 [Acidobacteria bacterium 13_1_40CM_65_14]|nr:MAG: hypothetical protein AUH43_16910 [Acidobacteria bacterium 13_1_40CM_65_14]